MRSASVSRSRPASIGREYLLAVRRGERTIEYRDRLADLDVETVAALREDEAAALAFWLNVYNAAVQDTLMTEPESYRRRWTFFRREVVTVAGTSLSLDDLEHGILRGSRSKYGFGYLPWFFPSTFERRVRLRTVDPRIHFALNCGAESCPAIRVFRSDAVDEQLDSAAAAYLDRTVAYDPSEGVVRLPRIFLWFYGDFGGKSAVLRLLRAHDIIPPDATPKLRFRDFDWSRHPERFADDS